MNVWRYQVSERLKIDAPVEQFEDGISSSRPRLTTACARPRISVLLIISLAVAASCARRVRPGVRLLPLTVGSEVTNEKIAFRVGSALCSDHPRVG